MKKQVIRTTDEAARLADVRMRIYRDNFALAPWDNTNSPLVYWSPSYTCDESATPCPTVEADGEEKTAPGIYRAQVYACDHGDVTVSTRRSCGCFPCGCVWCTVEAFRSYYGDCVSFEQVARWLVADIDAYYNGYIYAVTLEEWDASARDWASVDTCGDFYQDEDDAATLAALVEPFMRPGRVVCADDDAQQFVGMEYEDGAPMDGPTVAHCDAA